MFHLATTRFNTETFKENERWRKNNNWTGCIYGTAIPISKSINQNEKVFIIEMNNETNCVEGIGCVKKYIRYDLETRIYKEPSYNTYIYRSTFRIDKIEPRIKQFLEFILFKGKSHLKRSQGITIIPLKWKKKKCYLPNRLLKWSIIQDIRRGETNIIKKYRKLQSDLFKIFDIYLKSS